MDVMHLPCHFVWQSDKAKAKTRLKTVEYVMKSVIVGLERAVSHSAHMLCWSLLWFFGVVWSGVGLQV